MATDRHGNELKELDRITLATVAVRIHGNQVEVPRFADAIDCTVIQPDDGEPITSEWLTEIGFNEQEPTEMYRYHQAMPLCAIPSDGGIGIAAIGHAELVTLGHYDTRGQLRALMSALTPEKTK